MNTIRSFIIMGLLLPSLCQAELVPRKPTFWEMFWWNGADYEGDRWYRGLGHYLVFIVAIIMIVLAFWYVLRRLRR